MNTSNPKLAIALVAMLALAPLTTRADRFGLRGMGVAPAGSAIAKTGHHHLLIDVAQMPALNLPIPADANHVHFGGGQTETTVKLSPGKHTLQLNLADALHMQFDPPVLSPKITITVK